MKKKFLYCVVLGMESEYFVGIAEEKQVAHCKSSFVETKLKLCPTCPTHGSLAHVFFDDGTGSCQGEHYCPILIHDLFKATWDLRAVNGTMDGNL